MRVIFIDRVEKPTPMGKKAEYHEVGEIIDVDSWTGDQLLMSGKARLAPDIAPVASMPGVVLIEEAEDLPPAPHGRRGRA